MGVLLEKEFLACGSSIRTLRLQEKEHRKNGKEEISKISCWYNMEIIRAYRLYAAAKLLVIREKIRYHDEKSVIVNLTLKKTKQSITLLVKSKKRFNNLPSKSLLGIEVLTNTPKLNRLRNTIKERLKLQKKLQKTYAALLKSQNSLLTMESRQGRLLSVLNKLEAHPIISTFHNYTEESQNIVDMILLDQRCRPGQKILKLWEAIKATEINEIPPHEIVDFLQDFVDQTATEFGVPDELLNQLRLC